MKKGSSQSSYNKKMAKGFFITGTDTGVGKTIISAALIKAVHMLGLKACGMKPIETGCSKQKLKVQSSKLQVQDTDLTPHDGMFLKKISGVKASLDLITPVRFENPLAPLTASEREGRAVDLRRIKKAYQKLSLEYDAMIVEGIGGLLVPIRKNYFVLDLASDLGLPVVVVARPGLGTINHTMLTVNYALKAGLTIAGIIINYVRPPEGTPAEVTNPGIIRQISAVPLLGVFPFLNDFKSATIEKAAARNLDREIIKEYLAG
jgi:dethiobiotin synthetase